MKAATKSEWEEMCPGTSRMRIFKGWLVKVVEPEGVALVTVSDTNGEWRINPEIVPEKPLEEVYR